MRSSNVTITPTRVGAVLVLLALATAVHGVEAHAQTLLTLDDAVARAMTGNAGLHVASAGLAEAEEGIVAHMNEDHADAVQLYAHRLLKRTGNGWKMTGIDRAGIDLRKGGDVGRLEFDMPLSAVEEARGVLVSLVAKARAS